MKKSKCKLTVQQRCLGLINRLESKIKGIRKKVQEGGFGVGNNFDVEEFSAAMDDIGEVELEMEYYD